VEPDEIHQHLRQNLVILKENSTQTSVMEILYWKNGR
jgi:hypothetical protein